VVAYHGCDQRLVEQVLISGERLNKSRNNFDWLGEGIYFWENSYQRALDFAGEQQRRGKVQKIAVLGAYLHLGRCFDLTDLWATQRLESYYHMLKESMDEPGFSMPENRPTGKDDHDLLLRNLDCAVINLAMADLDQRYAGAKQYYYQTVRGVFQEGLPAYPGARIHLKTHIQISVRDPSCVIGYFKPVQAEAIHDS
jgi:hypothetical protein